MSSFPYIPPNSNHYPTFKQMMREATEIPVVNAIAVEDSIAATGDQELRRRLKEERMRRQRAEAERERAEAERESAEAARERERIERKRERAQRERAEAERERAEAEREQAKAELQRRQLVAEGSSGQKQSEEDSDEEALANPKDKPTSETQENKPGRRGLIIAAVVIVALILAAVVAVCGTGNCSAVSKEAAIAPRTSMAPTISAVPSEVPTVPPTNSPTLTPPPTKAPAIAPPPTPQPTLRPVVAPTLRPVASPVEQPVADPTSRPVVSPTRRPVVSPTPRPVLPPTIQPMAAPVVAPTFPPVVQPTFRPVVQPTFRPVVPPTFRPVVQPTFRPVVAPTLRPVVAPVSNSPVPPDQGMCQVWLRHVSGGRSNDGKWSLNNLFAFTGDGNIPIDGVNGLTGWHSSGVTLDFEVPETVSTLAFASQDATSLDVTVSGCGDQRKGPGIMSVVHWSDSRYRDGGEWTIAHNNIEQYWSYNVVRLSSSPRTEFLPWSSLPF